MTNGRRPRCLLLILLLVPSAALAARAQDSDARDDETVKVDTSLVSFPVVVTTRAGAYVADLRKEELSVEEDGTPQEVVFFGSSSQPFTVVLMIDTSASTQEKIGLIQRAAVAFVEQLKPQDRVKVVSFDDEVREMSAFTSDKAELRRAVSATAPGKGTKLYDAVQLALNRLRGARGRKAVVLFTDGVDYRSFDYREFHNLRALEESDVIVYPIRFETRAETERLARQQAAGGGAADLGKVIGGPAGGSTPTTFPSEEGGGGTVGVLSRVPTVVPRRPVPEMGDPRETRRDDPSARTPDGREGSARRTRRDDALGQMLDALYKTADAYLAELAQKSGGRVVRADTLEGLPAAFEQVAAELRTQYYVGYYPTRPVSEGRYRKIKVRTTRKDATVRARPGYTAVKRAGA